MKIIYGLRTIGNDTCSVPSNEEGRFPHFWEDKAQCSGRSTRIMAISSQLWNLGQRRQSFQALRGSAPRSTSRKPILQKNPGRT
jgi:hypothetical protein